MQTTIAIFTECFRCQGFRRAFASFPGSVCFRCSGGLRDNTIRPVWRLADFEVSRADAIDIISHALEAIGSKRAVGKDGRPVSPYGFVEHIPGDTWKILAATFSRCDATVRARGYRAAVAKIRATEWSNGDAQSRVDALNAAIATATGVPADRVAAWATGETAAVAA